MKRRGWYGDSHRHYLAAKGIKTKFDIKKYQGRWRQVSVKNEPYFQKGCGEVQADYKLNKDGTVSVTNFCEKDGKKIVIEGKAYPTKKDNVLKVDFFPWIPGTAGDYVVEDVNPEHTKATVRGGDVVWKLEKVKDKKQYLMQKDDPDYIKWRRLVNMSPEELRAFKNTKDGKEAGLTRREAQIEGIRSGQNSADAILRMRGKSPEEWTDYDEDWMRRQNSFVARMKGVKGPLYDEKGNPTRKHTALKIWGHDPEKKKPWQGNKYHPKLAKKKQYMYTPTYVAADLPLIAADAVGTAGAATVTWIPLVIGAGVVYGGAKYAKSQVDKNKKKTKKKKKKK